MNLHLLKVFPDQLANNWESFRSAIEKALPPTADYKVEGRATSILQSLLAGRLELLQLYDQNDDGTAKEIGIAVVGELDNIDYTSKDLLIYAIYAYDRLSRSEVLGGFELLVKYAKGLNCDAVVAYTNIPNLVKYVKRMGGQGDYTFIRLEI